MNIVYKKLDQIMPYERNPRANDKAVNYVADSIKEFGFKNPIIIDAAGVIVCGHTRYKAAKQLGMQEVPCIMADDLTPYQIAAFRLADNKVSEFSNWDFSLLEGELSEIDSVIDMTEFGFEEDPDYSYLEDLMNEDFANDHSLENTERFNITFSFPVEYKETIDQYVKEKGKNTIAEMIIKEAQKCLE